MEIILGLDVSTKCIGVTIAKLDDDYNLKLLEITHLRPKISTKIKGIECLLLKSKIFSDNLIKFKDYHITKVVIEEPLISSNNSITASTLLKFNGMISQYVYNILNIIPEFISSYDARKYAFPELMSIRKYNKKGEEYPLKKIRKSLKNNELVLFGSYQWDCDKKLILWNKINELYPNIPWVYKKNGELKDENFDASDSLVCVLGYVNLLQFKDCECNIIDFKEHNCDNGTIINYQTIFCEKIFDKKIEISK